MFSLIITLTSHVDTARNPLMSKHLLKQNMHVSVRHAKMANKFAIITLTTAHLPEKVTKKQCIMISKRSVTVELGLVSKTVRLRIGLKTSAR